MARIAEMLGFAKRKKPKQRQDFTEQERSEWFIYMDE